MRVLHGMGKGERAWAVLCSLHAFRRLIKRMKTHESIHSCVLRVLCVSLNLGTL